MIFHAVAHRLELAIHDAFDTVVYLELVDAILKASYSLCCLCFAVVRHQNQISYYMF